MYWCMVRGFGAPDQTELGLQILVWVVFLFSACVDQFTQRTLTTDACCNCIYIYIIHDIFYTVTCYNIHAYMLHTLRSPKTWNHYKPLIDLPRVDIIVYPVEELSVSPLEQLHPMNWSLPATVDLNALMMEVKQQNSHMDMGSKWQEFSCGKANHKARTKWPFPVKLGWFVIGLTPLVGSSTNS